MSKNPALSGLLSSKKKPAPVEPGPIETTYAGPIPAAGPRSDAKAKEIPSWQVGKRAVTVWVDEEQYLRLNEVAKQHRKPVRRLIFEAINMVLPVYDKLPVEDTEKASSQ